jgi:coenzyme F420-0:L-glutamate ligase/coenzyme F420-1:gamma-L-glutamate ligase
VSLTITAPDGAPEIGPGDDLAEILAGLLGPEDLRDGDIVVVTSKVVAKAEGRVRAGSREDAITAETVRVVARRGSTAIVRTSQGLTLAAAGVDASNVAAGHVVLLPEDPDASARRIRRRLLEISGAVVGVVVTDTAGRAWREGQTDIAIGAAGLRVLQSFAGHTDPHGNPLVVTAPAVADEIAGAAELAQGKLGARPFAVVRGRADLVLPVDTDGPGAAALVRPDATDMFGLGAREAVVQAAAGRDPAAFGAPAAGEEVAAAVGVLGVEAHATGDEVLVEQVTETVRRLLTVVAFAHGWQAVPGDNDSTVRLRPSGSFT